jgi:uncharacterized membrane protein YgcG
MFHKTEKQLNIRKYILFLTIYFLSLFVTPIKAQDTEYKYEKITQFNSFIEINQDATIDVTEEIHYYFPDFRHGIFWQYPIEYSASGFRRATSFDLEDVYYYPENDPEDRRSAYEETRSSGWIELKIGEDNRTITGNYVYVIKYTLQDVGISYFDTHDEVYFNVIGPGWQVPILEATANIKSFIDSTDRICYTGEEDSNQQNCSFSETDEGLILKTTTELQPYEALTFALKFPPDSIEDRSRQIWLGLIISNLGILLPIPVGIFLFRLLKTKWKNKKLTVIPHYEVPNDLDPLMAGYVYKGKLDYKHISATIIWLATRGHLTVEKEGKKTYLNKEVENIKQEASHIEDLFNALFSKEDKINIKKMPSTFTSNVLSVFSSVVLNSSEYIDKSRVKTKSLLSILGTLTVGFTIFVLFPILITFTAIGTGIGIIISGFILIIVSSKVDIRSEESNELYYQLEGLKMYINTAEKHRIEFHNDPEKFRGVFEKLLPFAIIFGLEKKWANEFKDLYKDTQPDWYRGDFSAFDAYMISRSISALNSSVKSATTKAYGSNSGYRSSGWSSGGSGFSGGSSGGGGGGSGGGSW